ncbi:hypothetical protein ID858_02140 [Xenorhabdus sp. DI]|uniref:hypothetical protein n=1 Tax=Xenorhabdus doucetiae TaxID=351671 RepID=UPI001991247F|nr:MULTISPECIES: hypothetical protein [unclassified Xenorhabdus]MBD2785044.1 hypothetical protein [Xenorhabdus sp. 3]MBD2787314.1 hypothetical protein [Xenorhabdus sp. DI]
MSTLSPAVEYCRLVMVNSRELGINVLLFSTDEFICLVIKFVIDGNTDSFCLAAIIY